MKKTIFTAEEVRKEFIRLMEGKVQSDVAKTIGVKPQNLSAMMQGASITGKVLKWIGFARIEVYERIK